ncbi:DNA primase [Albidovulum inexpectatum]|uniref:DNA primase n=1 Tax=Albidovulum inexpectatum TaxID=196587 RepID=A0A2S5JF48_9RHOB|nr:DNA primase [Albidovulum inexpectatum]PPB80136.1 DNA primase [Albidovulum inexpectatum]
MSLPPGFLEELRARTTLSQIVGRKVIWDMRKSNQAKGDWWAPCPFHQEKTASFHVDDRKGFYYCFGCHAKGDAIGFLKDAENMSFMEAVETLAREAGMTMPAQDPKAAERADRRSELARVMDEAVRWFRLQLSTGAGAEARDYLSRRGLSQSMQDRFEIGFAPDGRQALFQALTGRGIPADHLVAAGLCARPDDGGQPYDRFRNRIVFPIRDARGRCIAFGGRAMDPNARAKYLNSPETELFDKGRSLFNHGPAREAAGRGQQLIVVEGYMDVIALVGAGFEAAVAPLGTAITEDQLRMIWRIHPEPVVMLDGDTAGQRAAHRLIDLALPMLEAGLSLRFVMLPEGMDPDDLIRAQGREAMARLLAEARPMIDLLWQRETEGRVLDSPERRAALDKSLRELLRRIKDPSIRTHYGEEFKRLRQELFGVARSGGPGRAGRAGGWQPAQPGERRAGRAPFIPVAPLPETRNSLLARASDQPIEDYLREAMILAIALTHPSCVERFETELADVELRAAGHDRLRNALLAAVRAGVGGEDLRDRLMKEVGADLEKLMSLPYIRTAPPVRKAWDDELAAMCLAEELAKLEARRGAEEELAEAVEDIESLANEGLTWRLSQAVDARNRAGRTRLDDDSDLGEDRAAMSNWLQELVEKASEIKKKR